MTDVNEILIIEIKGDLQSSGKEEGDNNELFILCKKIRKENQRAHESFLVTFLYILFNRFAMYEKKIKIKYETDQPGGAQGDNNCETNCV